MLHTIFIEDKIPMQAYGVHEMMKQKTASAAVVAKRYSLDRNASFRFSLSSEQEVRRLEEDLSSKKIFV